MCFKDCIFGTTVFALAVSAALSEHDLALVTQNNTQLYNKGAYGAAAGFGGIVAIVLNLNFYFIVKEACCIVYLQ